jgi:uncharacterized membrane protein YgcG
MIKYFYYFFFASLFFSCKEKKSDERLLVDAGSFLDSTQSKEIEGRLKDINNKRVYHLFLYTVIAEKYYKHINYDSYVFNTLSKKDSVNNLNVLLYLSYDDRKVIIHTGNKAKEKLTDSLSQSAINHLKPYLSQREFFDGFKSTINYIDSIFMKTSNGAE